MANAASGLGSKDRGYEDLEGWIQRLYLNDEDYDDVVSEDEGPPLAEATHWLALARFHTVTSYSQY